MAVDIRDRGAKGADRRSWWIAARVAFLMLVAFAGAPASAWATDATINFSSPTVSPGNMLTTQYASQGVTFGQSPLGPSQAQPLDVESSSLVPAPANVARQLCVVEICTLSQWIEFSPEVNHVSMSVAAAGTMSTSVTLTAYDSGGNAIAGSGGSDTQTVTSTSLKSLSVSAAGAATTIAFVQVTANDGSQGEGFEFTDLSYGPIATTPTPDFGLANPGSTGGIVVNAGDGPASATLILRRFGGSTGPIDFSYSIPPMGVTVSVTPTPDSGGDGSTVTVTYTASAGAAAVSEYPITITGTPESSSAGTTQHSITVPVTVITPGSAYTLRIQGLELTQGIQTFTLPTPTPPSRTVAYSGVKLVYGMPAVVRVFADAPNAPTSPPSSPNQPGNGLVPGVGVQLAGFDSEGRPLPGSPLQGGMPPLSATNSATVPVFERVSSANNVYDFDLPTSWLFDAASLTATLTPPPLSLTSPSAAVPCTDPSCVALRTFTLTGITSVTVGETQIATILMENGGVTPPFFGDFAWAKQLIPAGINVGPPLGTIDIDWIANGCYKKVFGHVCFSRSAKNGEALGEVQDYAHHQLHHLLGDTPIIGISNPNVGSNDLGIETGNIGQNQPAAVVDYTRSLTDIAHEIGHMFHLSHASKACGGNGQSWPPDQVGYIDGIGLDIAAPVPSTPGTTTYGPEYPALAGQPPGDAGSGTQQFYDFMSYCANGSNPDSVPGYPAVNSNPADGALASSDAWISVRNWDYIASEAACFYAALNSSNPHKADKPCYGAGLAAQTGDANAAGSQQANEAAVQPSAKAAEADGPGMTSVYGYLAPEGANISIVDPTPSSQPLTGSPSPMSLELQGARGRVIARAPLLVTDTHVDPHGNDRGGPLVLFEGAVPTRTAASAIAVVSDGQVLTIDRKPAREPRLTLLAPLSNQRVKGKARVVVRWHATNPEQVHLMVSVDFSSNNGRTWRTVYMGENTGRVSLPGAYFTHSKSARVRVRVNDGFDQVSSTSGRFTIQKTKPRAKHRH